MSTIGFTTLINREDSVLSPHFGLAKWVMIRDNDTGNATFEQNTALYGQAVVDILQRHGCTDVVFAEIGYGAFRGLQEAGIRGWLAPMNVPVPQLLDHFNRGELTQAEGPTEGSSGLQRRQRRGVGHDVEQKGMIGPFFPGCGQPRRRGGRGLRRGGTRG
jgi:predicted Fe-Mo cluster-binding NifX family protein